MKLLELNVGQQNKTRNNKMYTVTFTHCNTKYFRQENIYDPEKLKAVL